MMVNTDLEEVQERFLKGVGRLLASPAHSPKPEPETEIEPEPKTVDCISLDVPILPDFPPDVLPSWVNAMAEAVANQTETPRELAALFGLAVLATGCQGSVEVEVEPGYTEPLNVWTVTALPSGHRKTAVMKLMVAPVMEYERDRCAAVMSTVAETESERETIKAKVKALRTRAAEDDSEDFEDKKQAIAKLEGSIPAIPTLPRLWVQDITPEKLGQVMSENGERISIISDEGGLFDILAGRYSNGIPNLDTFLQAHAGSPVRVDRGSRPPVVMNHPALTIALSPQPDVLRGMTDKPGFRGRGLLARFLYSLPQSRLGYRTLKSHPIPPAILDTYRQKIKALLGITPPTTEGGDLSPYQLKLEPSAYSEWKEFQCKVEEELRAGGEFEYIQDWAGKLPGAAARIAGLFHCAIHTDDLPSNLAIHKGTMHQALALAAFLGRHALAAFNVMGADPELEAARRVWKWIDLVKNKTFTARDCFQALRGTYPRMENLTPAFAVLIERGYLSDSIPQSDSSSKPGRKSRKLLVNPILTDGKEWV